jgi:isocitrate lyase
MGGKVLIPTNTAVRNLVSARLAMDVMDVPTVLVARTDANGATLMMSDADPYDRVFSLGERTPEGFVRAKAGVQAAISRGLAYAPYADMIWCETAEPDIEEAKQFAEGVLSKFPGKLLAYNCSPSFNWKKKLDDSTIAKFQRELGAMGYKFQFVTLAGFHALNFSMYDLALDYSQRGMAAYAEFQAKEFAMEAQGYTATKHQREVGAGYFDDVTLAIVGEGASTVALKGSTEEAQFH